MNNELVAILSYMEKERGIERETLIQAVEYALQTASRKIVGGDAELRIEIDRKTCDIRAFANVEVVESPGSVYREISLSKAREIAPSAKFGDRLDVEVPPGNLGRIAAQTAKQAIIQRIRQAERDIVFDEYKDRVGDIISGTVRQFNRGDLVVDLGRGEGVLPVRERVPTEDYQVGDRIRALILNVQSGAPGPGVVLSRASPDFVRALFRLEVSEMSDNIVEIKGIAREPGFRTKIAVASRDEKVDPVGACVGMRGLRVKNIVRELSGEKIDIIRWSDDIKTYAVNALSPAKLSKVVIDPNVPRLIRVTADADQLSLAIGKRGQNVRLTAKLLGWRVDVERDEAEVSFETKLARAVELLGAIEGIGAERAAKLAKAGFLTVEGILAADPEVLQEQAGFDAETAVAIYEAAAAETDKVAR